MYLPLVVLRLGETNREEDNFHILPGIMHAGKSFG